MVPGQLIERTRERRQYNPTIPVPRDHDWRREYVRDRSRIIHAASFRALQGKSQIFGAGSGDYYRTRLTHTLEVAQIARDLVNRLACRNGAQARAPLPGFTVDPMRPGLIVDPDVVECAALAHDIGHPPFGHKGEAVLDRLLRDEGYCFEGNAQSVRLLMHLEKRWERGETQEIRKGRPLRLRVFLHQATA